MKLHKTFGFILQRTIDFLTNNEPKRWVFPTIMPRLNETNEEDLAFVTKARFRIKDPYRNPINE